MIIHFIYAKIFIISYSWINVGVKMVVNYKKLWKILIDRNMRKEDLRVAAGITTTAMAKLGRNETVHMDILLKICKVLDCKIEDIVEITNDVV